MTSTYQSSTQQNNKMWNRFSIKIQLILFMTLVVSIVAFSTLFIIHNLQKEDTEKNVILEIETITKSVNNDLLKYIFYLEENKNTSATMLSDITLRLSAFDKITALVLYNKTNLAIYNHGEVKKLLSLRDTIPDTNALFTKDNLYIKKDIFIENIPYGHVIIEVNLSQYKLQQEKIITIFLLIFFVALSLGLIVSLYLSKSYTKPFSTMLNAMKKSDPTQNKIILLETSAQNEIKELFDGYNDLMKQIQLSTQEIQKLNQDIEDTQREVVFTMGAIGETRSKETGNHVKRVAHYSKIFALHYGLNEYDADMLKQASPMHDIGKVGIPDSVLNKPGRFDKDERKVMDTHAQLGYDMLKGSNKPLLKLAATVAYEHHEKWDGTGYPNQLQGEEINIAGRITAIADVFDALGSDRVYKKAWDDERIFNLFREERAKHFDPKLIDIFFDNLDEFLNIRKQFKDL